MFSKQLTLSSRSLFALLALGAFAIDAGGITLQTLLKLDPCPLCIFQRLIYMVLCLLGLVGIFLSNPLAHRRLAVGVLSISLIGWATAAYQSWIQAFPEAAKDTCRYTDPNLIEQFVDWLGMLYPPLFMATGFCTDKAFVLLGLSMANWSLLTLTAIVGTILWRLRRPA